MEHPPLRARITRSGARLRGSAMIEMVLVLPLLVLILLLLLYFGRAGVRVQHAAVADRYEAWRRAGSAPGPAADRARGDVQLNRTFFAGNARRLEASASRWFPPAAGRALAQAGAGYGPDTGPLIERTLADLPAGQTVTVKVDHEERLALWRRLDRPIRRDHTRLGNDWRFVNAWQRVDGAWRPAGGRVSHAGSVRSVFLGDFDQALAGGYGGNGVAGMIRGLYLGSPGYAGPDFSYGP